MNQGAQFVRSVVIKTCWLTPVVVTVNDLVGGPASVHGRSMQPTLNPLGSTSNDLVLVDKLSIRLFKYSRGDVVLFRYVVCHLCCETGFLAYCKPIVDADLLCVLTLF